MRTLIYKRTHTGDPDPKTGVFGNNDCMGSVRKYRFDAVIGIGGIGKEPRAEGIDGKLTWIGVGSEKFDGSNRPGARGPQVKFRHFLDLGVKGPVLKRDYPTLARRMYDGKIRYLIHSPGKFPDIDGDVERILRLGLI